MYKHNKQIIKKLDISLHSENYKTFLFLDQSILMRTSINKKKNYNTPKEKLLVKDIKKEEEKNSIYISYEKINSIRLTAFMTYLNFLKNTQEAENYTVLFQHQLYNINNILAYLNVYLHDAALSSSDNFMTTDDIYIKKHYSYNRLKTSKFYERFNKIPENQISIKALPTQLLKSLLTFTNNEYLHYNSSDLILYILFSMQQEFNFFDDRKPTQIYKLLMKWDKINKSSVEYALNHMLYYNREDKINFEKNPILYKLIKEVCQLRNHLWNLYLLSIEYKYEPNLIPNSGNCFEILYDYKKILIQKNPKIEEETLNKELKFTFFYSYLEKRLSIFQKDIISDLKKVYLEYNSNIKIENLIPDIQKDKESTVSIIDTLNIIINPLGEYLITSANKEFNRNITKIMNNAIKESSHFNHSMSIFYHEISFNLKFLNPLTTDRLSDCSFFNEDEFILVYDFLLLLNDRKSTKLINDYYKLIGFDKYYKERLEILDKINDDKKLVDNKTAVLKELEYYILLSLFKYLKNPYPSLKKSMEKFINASIG